MVKIFRKPILFHHFTLFLPFYYFLTLNKGKLFLALCQYPGNCLIQEFILMKDD